MPSDSSMMLRTAACVYSAMAVTYVDVASRCLRFACDEARRVVGPLSRPLSADRESRQTEVEDAVWTLYSAHNEVLRAVTGTSNLAAIVFLNELDLQRGPRLMPNYRPF